MAAHKIEVAPYFRDSLAGVPLSDGTVVKSGEVLEVETSDLTLEALLMPQLLVDGQSYERRLGLPERGPVVVGVPTQVILGGVRSRA